jgi:hypothetical protein
MMVMGNEAIAVIVEIYVIAIICCNKLCNARISVVSNLPSFLMTSLFSRVVIIGLITEAFNSPAFDHSVIRTSPNYKGVFTWLVTAISSMSSFD